jgi:hypothetical protein
MDSHIVEETWMRRDGGAELYVLSAQKNFVESDPHLGTGQHRPEAVMGAPATKANVRIRRTADVELERIFKYVFVVVG